ncbi:hypothetical protein KY363_07960, partial [Candidatus Woesearchaeota archaeon]|nr:hypothetical protein [Candidatus Woesearchaeota archaeon]
MKANKEPRMKLRLSNNVLFVLAIALVLLNSYTFISVSKDMVTGKASAEGETRICIGTEYSMTQPTPLVPVVLNSSFNSTLSGNNILSVIFSYYYTGIVEIPFGTDYDVDDDNTFNATLNVSALPDGNCNYRIIARGESYCSQNIARGSATFSVNNIDVPPKWTEFNNSESTNFSMYSSWADLPGSKIAVPPYGEIGFTTTNFDSADLDYMFNIEYNNISLNVSYMIDPCFSDVQFLIKIYNATQFAAPVVFKNGVPCGASCHSEIYDGENVSFVTNLANEHAVFSVREGGNLTINWTFWNKTYDNTPTLTFTTYMVGDVKNVTSAAYCLYKTDYDPTDFTVFESNETINHTIRLPEQNWSYLPTNLGHYPNIQHHTYYSGLHTLTVNCSIYPGAIDYQELVENTTFLLTYTERDRVYYSDNDSVTLFLPLEEENLIILANFSQLDSTYNPSSVKVTANTTNYTIQYNISDANTFADRQGNVTIEAFLPNGTETMNGTIFVHLHNNWQRSDIDDAFDCWNFKQGYYFDEVACDWESDLNQVADLVDVYPIETECFDGIDNDRDCCSGMFPNGTCYNGIDSNGDGVNCSTGDLLVDVNDTDCPGIWYSIRRDEGIDSAFLGDPCHNNVCRVCLGAADANNDGICDSSTGVNVRYLDAIRPGYWFRSKFNKNLVSSQSVRLSINYLESQFHVNSSVSSIKQLPAMELGGCTGGEDCKSVTATTFNPPNPDT